MAKPLAKLLSLLTPKRCWAQFSLATMFVGVTVLCVWLAVVVNRAHRQRDAVAAFEALGGTVEYAEPDESASEAFPKRFLRRWLARDYFDDVIHVKLYRIQIPDAGLAHLEGLTSLRQLDLGEDALVTDAGLCHLEGLTRLQQLSLNCAQVTDAGMAHLQGLTAMQWLLLNDTRVGDTGLAHLEGLTGLQWLHLNDSQVTDAGVAQLRKALPIRYIGGP